jgi:hypothetical protein
MKTPMIGAALALLAACAAQTRTEAPLEGLPILAPPALAEPLQTAPVAVTCEIRETKTADGIRLEAIVRADRDVPGTYDLVVTAQGAGGASDITQGGPVDLQAGQSAIVGSAEIPRGRYRAILTLTDAHGELCRRERTS